MTLLTRIVAIFALVVSMGTAAFAQDLTDAQRQGLEAQITKFDTAMRANDMATIFGTVPPKVMEAIASQFGVTNEQLIEAGQAQLDAAMASIKLESFGMDVAAAEVHTLPDGMVYALIPTETVMDLGAAGGKMRATGATLGLLDGETWYLIRVEDAQQVAILKQVYPGFADVTFPTGSMEPVTQ